MKELFLTEDNRLGTCMFCGERLKKRLNDKGKGIYTISVGCNCGKQFESSEYKGAHIANREGVNEFIRYW